jgi:hypothetical protein
VVFMMSSRGFAHREPVRVWGLTLAGHQLSVALVGAYEHTIGSCACSKRADPRQLQRVSEADDNGAMTVAAVLIKAVAGGAAGQRCVQRDPAKRPADPDPPV